MATPSAAARPSPVAASRLSQWSQQAVRLLPGLLLTLALARLGEWTSDRIGKDLMGFASSPVSGTMMAIIIGLVIGNVLTLSQWLSPGIKFSAKHVLHTGIILLGFKLTFTDVLRLGALGIPVIAVCIVGGIALTKWLGQRLRLSARLSTLVAVGSSICGASAVAAAGPAIEAKEEEMSYAIANITLFGIIAMFLYPYIGHLLFADNPTYAGLFLGTSIHNTAQVAGAGVIYSQVYLQPDALNAATVTKLVRNLCMALVIPFMAYTYRRQNMAGGKQVSVISLLPRFVLGFLLLAILRTVGSAALDGGTTFLLWDAAGWAALGRTVGFWSELLLVMSMAAIGLSTSIKQLRGLGIRPFYVGLGSAVFVGVLSVAAIFLLGALGLG